ncbi:MAG: zf-HC2 domain-containing protein [Bdellovibrionota bacterium]
MVEVQKPVSCRRVTELVTDYLERRLPFWERLRFQYHLFRCVACRRYIREVRQIVKTTGELPAEPPPPEIEKELLERFRNWKRTGG